MTWKGDEEGWGGARNVLSLDPSASYMGFHMCGNSTTVHLRFLLISVRYIAIFKNQKLGGSVEFLLLLWNVLCD